MSAVETVRIAGGWVTFLRRRGYDFERWGWVAVGRDAYERPAAAGPVRVIVVKAEATDERV